MREQVKAAIEGAGIEDKMMSKTADSFIEFMQVGLALTKEIVEKPVKTAAEEAFIKSYCEYNLHMMAMTLFK